MNKSKGFVFEGNFINGWQEGYGEVSFDSIHVFETFKGVFKKGTRLNGFEEFDLNHPDCPDLYFYKGGYTNDIKSGKGAAKFKTGEEYNGNWKNGQMNGYGVMIIGKDTISGIWKDGKLDSLNYQLTRAYWKIL